MKMLFGLILLLIALVSTRAQDPEQSRPSLFDMKWTKGVVVTNARVRDDEVPRIFERAGLSVSNGSVTFTNHISLNGERLTQFNQAMWRKEPFTASNSVVYPGIYMSVNPLGFEGADSAADLTLAHGGWFISLHASDADGDARIVFGELDERGMIPPDEDGLNTISMTALGRMLHQNHTYLAAKEELAAEQLIRRQERLAAEQERLEASP